jgi:hypothetical protein
MITIKKWSPASNIKKPCRRGAVQRILFPPRSTLPETIFQDEPRNWSPADRVAALLTDGRTFSNSTITVSEISCFISAVLHLDSFCRTTFARPATRDYWLWNQMRNLFSTVMGGIVLIVAIAFSSCASSGGGVASSGQRPPPSDGGVTIGPATVAPGTSEFESPWPFGPLGMD